MSLNPRYRLSSKRIRILAVCDQSSSVSSLAITLGEDRGGLQRELRWLEAEGMITRSPSPLNANRTQVRRTVLGERVHYENLIDLGMLEYSAVREIAA